MDLDDLKAKWHKEAEENRHLNKQTMEQLQAILKTKTSGTLAGVKEKYARIISLLTIGLLLNVLISPFLHFLLGDDGPVFRLTVGGLLSLVTLLVGGLLVIFFYWRKYKQLEDNAVDENLKKALIDNISGLRRSLKQEIYFIVALFAGIFILARGVSQYLGNGDFGDIFHLDILLSMLVGVSIMAFYIYKRVSAYQKNIAELKKYLSEFEDSLSLKMKSY